MRRECGNKYSICAKYVQVQTSETSIYQFNISLENTSVLTLLLSLSSPLSLCSNMPPRIKEPPPLGRLLTCSSNTGKHPGYVDIGKPAPETPKTTRTRKHKVTKAVKSAQELAANIKCLATHEKESLNDDDEATTPYPLFTPASVYLGKYKLPLPRAQTK